MTGLPTSRPTGANIRRSPAATCRRAAPSWLARVRGAASVLGAALALVASSAPLFAQAPPPSDAQRITVEWVSVPIEDVLGSFAEYSGKSIVAGPEVTGFVTAYVADRPWDVALGAILSAHGLMAVEDDHGIIRVTGVGARTSEDAEEAILTRTYRLSFAKASELAATLAPHLSERGRISVAESTNSLVISDVARIHRMIGGMIP